MDAVSWTLVALLGLLFYAQAGYPLLMAVLARCCPRPLRSGGADMRALSVVVCVRNAGGIVAGRLRNLLDCEWSGELEILVYCDGCTDDTAAQAASIVDPRVRIITGEVPLGKALALNAAIPLCRHPLVVLCDVRQRFEKETLQRLAAPFADPAVAAVSGRLEIAASAAGGGQGVDLYWRIERKLREWESRHDSVIGCSGAVCAIRRDAFEPLDGDTLLDDVVIPMRMAARGGRVIFEPEALAYDPQTLDPARERVRKLRTLVGNYQMLERHPGWLLPWRQRLWWQLLSHKYLRLAVPWLLIAIAVLTPFASRSAWTLALAAGQIGAYACALLGLLWPRARWKLLTVPAGFLLLQWSCLRAFFAYLVHRRDLRALWTAPPTP
jgi:cellulose synthase/poly-beta-1,6-N-acetylglucosamine synthase-like glycosyltransferase